MSSDIGPSAFERDTLHRIATETARYWLISYYLATKQIPRMATLFAYLKGAVS